jgi:hypothetical protein
MRLLIAKEYNPGFNEELYTLKTSMLKSTSTHLFIAANRWDAICIELDDDIPETCLCNMNLICENITVKLPEEITDKTLRLLCELYPDKSGALRRVYMCKGDIKEVLSCYLAH